MKNEKICSMLLLICMSTATGYSQSRHSTSSSSTFMASAAESGPLNPDNRIVPQPDLHLNTDKQKQPGRCLRNTGIALTASGIAATVVGAFLMYNVYELYDKRGDHYYDPGPKTKAKNAACLSTFLIGPPLALSGGITWIIGQRKLNRNRALPSD